MYQIKGEKEKQEYFEELIKGTGAYFNVKYPDGENEFIWVKKFENWNEDGSHWYLESPNQLMKYPNITSQDLEPYYDEEDDETYESPFVHCYLKDETAYEIESWQTSPYLPEQFEIEFVTDIENEAVEYMLNQ